MQRRVFTFFIFLGFIAVNAAAAIAATSVPIEVSQVTKCDIEFANLGAQGILTAKSELIARYLHRSFATIRENRRWIRLAKESDEKSGVVFGDTEFSNLQKVNTLTNDKNFATSVSNKHKELTVEMLKTIRDRHKGLVDIVIYSDFKSVRYAIVGKKPLKAVPAQALEEITKSLEAGFLNVNALFETYIVENGLDVAEAGALGQWFRGGLGHTADQANFAARTSRDMGGGNPLRNFSDPEIHRNLSSYHKWAEQMRTDDLLPDPAMGPLVDKGFIRDDVLDLIKKTPDLSAAQERIRSKYGTTLNDDQIQRLQIYNEIIDKFSPGIFVAERRVASLEDAHLGGLSADFSGLSAKNRGATARAIAEGKNLEDVLALARKNEQELTKVFTKLSRAFTKTVGRYLSATVSSGDDFVGHAAKVWTLESKQRLTNDVAKLEYFRIMRLSESESPTLPRIAFIGQGVAMKDRNLLAAHGEAIEKELRKELEGKISNGKLNQLIFGIDMHGKAARQGDVSLFVGEGSQGSLSPTERGVIETAFKAAVPRFNSRADSDNALSDYLAK